MEATILKLYQEDGTIRRLTLPSTTLASFDAVLEALQKLYNEDVFHPELKIQYVDAEGDKCTISSSMEWDCFISGLVPGEVLKLYISEGIHKGRYFKDGPPPEVKTVYVKEQMDGDTRPKAQEIPIENPPDLALRVPECLQRLFPGKKILPYHLPTWLKPFVQLKKVPDADNEVDLDIDITGLLDELHRQALNLLNNHNQDGDIQKAKDFLESMLILQPDNPIALYNMACAEALAGNADAAVQALTQAIERGGYSDASHMRADPDLESLKSLPEYQELLKRISTDQLEKEEQRTDGADEGFVIVENELLEEAKKQSPEIEGPGSAAEELAKLYVEMVSIEEEPKVEENSRFSYTLEEAEKPQDEVENFAFEAQLQQLLDMGFDRDLCIERLNARTGDLDAVLNDIL